MELSLTHCLILILEMHLEGTSKKIYVYFFHTWYMQKLCSLNVQNLILRYAFDFSLKQKRLVDSD